MQWRTHTSPIPNGIRYTIHEDGRELSFRDVVEGWQSDAGFRSFYNDTLRGAPYEAMFWETPAITAATLDRVYEFALLDAPALAGVDADPGPFAAHFSGQSVATFPNLGGDAILIAPSPAAGWDFAHLAQFVRTASADLTHDFWRAVGVAVVRHVGDEPRWLSTSGLGVYWLHVRLDARPKYYTHGPYRSLVATH